MNNYFYYILHILYFSDNPMSLSCTHIVYRVPQMRSSLVSTSLYHHSHNIWHNHLTSVLSSTVSHVETVTPSIFSHGPLISTMCCSLTAIESIRRRWIVLIYTWQLIQANHPMYPTRLYTRAWLMRLRYRVCNDAVYAGIIDESEVPRIQPSCIRGTHRAFNTPCMSCTSHLSVIPTYTPSLYAQHLTQLNHPRICTIHVYTPPHICRYLPYIVF
jgi:hypothetical protein